jgi:hypothetical protein
LNLPGSVRPVCGKVDAEGRLIEADPPLARMHEKAGGEMGDALAIPRIASLVRLARRLQIPISRPMTAAEGDRDVAMVVRVDPLMDGAELSITGWNERSGPPALAAIDAERRRDFARAAAEWSCETDASLGIVRMAALPHAVGRKLYEQFELSRGPRGDRKSTRLNSSHNPASRMPSSA